MTRVDGRMEFVNKAAVALFGYGAHEMMGENVGMLMSEPYASRHESFMRRCVNFLAPALHQGQACASCFFSARRRVPPLCPPPPPRPKGPSRENTQFTIGKS